MGRFRLLAVHAHPDDESSKGGATMARYACEGVDVLVATCTGGERGDVLNPRVNSWAVRGRLASLRRREMAEASAILGVRQCWLGYVDSGLPEPGSGDPLPFGCFARMDVGVAAGRLVEVIREFRPHVVLTYDETGGYPHPDHVMTHRISVLAFDAAADPRRYPWAGEPWQPLKLYYHMASRAQFVAEHRAMLAAGLASPHAELLPLLPCNDHRVTCRVPCADFFAVRDEALRAHVTQIDPVGEWFAVPLAIRRQAWPTEDFALARSLVGGVSAEDDLFAGIRLYADTAPVG